MMTNINFELDDDQMKRLEEWKKSIQKKYNKYGVYSYTFTPTGLGTIVEVYSEVSKTKLDLSDIDKW